MKKIRKIHFTILLIVALLLNGCQPIEGYQDYNIFQRIEQ